jgi:hypothetical protein
MGRGEVKKAADGEVLNHASIAVQQHEGLSLATLDIVQSDTINFHELPNRRIGPFRLPRPI